MAQHDYSIANQGFPATRADINNVLSAIATNNSGTSAPSTQYAGQFWIDTTSSNWVLYIHDGADDIQFATIDTSANTVNFIDSELADGSVTNAKLGADAVDGTKIADDSINSEHYVDGSIDTAHIADSQITTAKIADGNVTTSKLADSSVSLAKLTATGTKDATTFLRGDNTFASAGGTNTPNFFVIRTSNITISSNNVSTKITFDNKVYDTDNAYDTSTGKFTPQVAGKYFIIVQVRFSDTASNSDIATANIFKNGSNFIGQGVGFDSDYAPFIQTSGIVEMNGSTDYIEGYSYQRLSQIDIIGSSNSTFMCGYKIIE